MIALPCFLIACFAMAVASAFEPDGPAPEKLAPVFLEIE